MEYSQKQKIRQLHMKQFTTLVLLGILALFVLLNLIPGGKGSQKPKFYFPDILSGEYMEEYQSYQAETVAGRGIFVAVGNRLQTFFGKTSANGVYQGRDHFLFSLTEKMDNGKVQETVKALQGFDDAYYDISTSVMLIPDKANVMTDFLPPSAVMENQTEQFAQIQDQLGGGIFWVDVQKILKEHAKEELYYHTDEYWTSLGAYYGYEALAESMGYDTGISPDWKSYVVDNSFNGELSKRSGCESGYEDSIRIYSARDIKNNPSVLVENIDTGKKSATLYDTAKLKTDQKYDLFLGGECAYMDIKTNAATENRLLVLRDSYANCLIPFLTPYYREIVLIDPQIYEESLADVMEDVDFSDVLVLCSGNMFVQDESIAELLNDAAAAADKFEAGSISGNTGTTDEDSTGTDTSDTGESDSGTDGDEDSTGTDTSDTGESDSGTDGDEDSTGIDTSDTGESDLYDSGSEDGSMDEEDSDYEAE